MVCNFFNKKSKGTAIKNEIKQNEQLVEELHKPITGKLKKKKKQFHLLKIIFGVLILLTFNKYTNLIKEFVFHYVLLRFLVNMLG